MKIATVYMKRARSLTLEEMLITRKWLRRCLTELAKTDQDKIEIIKAGTALKTSIEIASSTDCDIAEW